ncbi:hypothetical protein BDF14DRAFT_1878323 [Spinellus fusiger]|nr:hypothetical protein BDF14DRAFT_1878323 [Spinellus fusiger]
MSASPWTHEKEQRQLTLDYDDLTHNCLNQQDEIAIEIERQAHLAHRIQTRALEMVDCEEKLRELKARTSPEHHYEQLTQELEANQKLLEELKLKIDTLAYTLQQLQTEAETPELLAEKDAKIEELTLQLKSVQKTLAQQQRR